MLETYQLSSRERSQKDHQKSLEKSTFTKLALEKKEYHERAREKINKDLEGSPNKNLNSTCKLKKKDD